MGDGNAGSDGIPTNWRYEPWNGDGQPPWNWRSAPTDEFGFRRNYQDSAFQPTPLFYPEYMGSDTDDEHGHGKYIDISDITIYEAYSPTQNDYVILVPRTIHRIPIKAIILNLYVTRSHRFMSTSRAARDTRSLEQGSGPFDSSW